MLTLMADFKNILTGPPIPDPPEPKRLQPGDPHGPPDMLSKLREFIPCQRDLSWQKLQDVAGDRDESKHGHTLAVNKVWSDTTAPAHFAGRYRSGSWKGGLFVFDGNVVIGAGSLEFCKAIKKLLDEGQLQALPRGLMQHAIDPLTGYWYQHEPPKLEGMHVSITPGE